jgi:oligopeptide transport system substrate-binding protein
MRMRWFWRFPALLLALLFGLLAAACDRSGADQAAAPPDAQADAKTLTYGLVEAPTQLDPHRLRSQSDYVVASALNVGLVMLDGRGQITPGMAESWNVSEDGLTYVFRLRQTQWSDGQAVKASDFVAGFRRLFNPRFSNATAPLLFSIKNAA